MTGMQVRADKRHGIADASTRALLVATGMLGMGWVYLYLADALADGLWTTGFTWWLASIVMWLYALADGAVGSPVGSRANRHHLWIFCAWIPAVLVLLDAGTRLSIAGLGGKGMLVSGIVGIGLFATVWVEARSSRKRLAESKEFGQPSLPDSGGSPSWDPVAVAAFLRSPAGKGSRSWRLWRLISPLLPAVGFALSRNLSDDFVLLLGCYLSFLLALLLGYGFAFHLGAAMYARSLDPVPRRPV